MKKLILAIALILSLCLPVVASETPEMCGNTYAYTYDATTYLIKFTSANPELPCTSGTATLYWGGEKLSYTFSIHNLYFADITGLGKFVADGDVLYFLDSTAIVFDIF